MDDRNMQIILVKLEAMDDRQNERHTELKQQNDQLRKELRDVSTRQRDLEAWKHEQVGRGKLAGLGTSAFVSAGIATLWQLITGRS